MLNHPEGKKLYIARMKELITKVFTTENIHKTIDDYAARGKLVAEAIDKNYAKDFANRAETEKQRMKERVEFVKKEVKNLK